MDFARVLRKELSLIGVRRWNIRLLAARAEAAKQGLPPPDAAAAGLEGGPPQEEPDDAVPPGAIAAEAAQPPVGPSPSEAEKQARLAAMDRHLAGLAISGGGIRSATFGLGVLQGLADLGILSRFDYLSTVSGGGYIGGWLAAWMKREGNPLSVEHQLSPSRITQSDAARD